jgi:CTP:molybdopterin cytidylyltransferase MocA
LFLRNNPETNAALAELDDPGLDLDMDTPEDFERARRMFFG